MVKVKGSILVRKTRQKDKFGRDVIVLLGVAAMESEDKDFYKDGHLYNIIEMVVNKEKDISDVNNQNSPEDLLEMKIWTVPK